MSRARTASATPPRHGADWTLLLTIAVAFALPLLGFMAFGDVGLSLWDEGFVWYGVQRVVEGELPLRDFQSYDIGRYYWSAAWMHLADSRGILAMRAGNAVLTGCTVALVMLLLRDVGQSLAMRLLAALIVALWVVPYFKVSDNFAAVLLVAGLSLPLARSSLRRWAFAGCCLGIAATIGINHALYGGVATLLTAAYLRLVTRQPVGVRQLAACGAGFAVGYAPMLLLLAAAPGFGESFVDSIRLLLEAGTTNLELPWPRPWAVLTDGRAGLRESLLGLAFAVVPMGLLLCLWHLRVAPAAESGRRAPAAFASAVFVSVPYLHYALSRADAVHVAVTILPLLVAAWAFPASTRTWLRPVALTGVALWTLLVAVPDHPGWTVMRGDPFVPVDVLDDILRVDGSTAEQVALVTRLAGEYARGERSLYAAPYWPGAYAVLNQRAPVWEIYALFPSRYERQLREIRRMTQARTSVAVLHLEPVDGRSDLGIERTHPAIVAFIRRCMHPIDLPTPRGVRVYVTTGERCTGTTAAGSPSAVSPAPPQPGD